MDRFSEDEARRIFAEAARASASREAPTDGLSLDELQEIGRAAGLNPAAVAAAAATVRLAEPDIEMWRGIPLATRRTRVVPGRLSDDAWAEAVSALRREFSVQGATEQIGRQRTWTHAVGESVQMLLVRVTAVETAAGTAITVESGPTQNRGAARGLGVGFGVAAAFFALLSLVIEGKMPGLWFAFAFALAGAGIYAAIRREAVTTSRRDPVRFDALLDRIERLATPQARPPEAPVGEAPMPDAPVQARIDAALLDADPPTGDTQPDSARRTRA